MDLTHDRLFSSLCSANRFCLWIPKRIHWIKKRWVDGIRQECVCWNLGFNWKPNFFSRFWTIVAEEWVHGAESESLSTHGFWSASFPAFQQKERASENKDTYLPRDRAQVHRFLLNGNWTSKEEVGAGGSWVGGCVWGKMLEEQLAYYLEKYLGNYVQGLSKEALKVSVWQGMYVYI